MIFKNPCLTLNEIDEKRGYKGDHRYTISGIGTWGKKGKGKRSYKKRWEIPPILSYIL